jgi:hypothetical protein
VLVPPKVAPPRPLGERGGAPDAPDPRLAPGSTESFLCLLPQPISEYTLRNLRDAVQNLQLQWCGDPAAGRGHAVDVPGIEELVDALFRRFGSLACWSGWGPSVMDDMGSLEDAQGDAPGGVWAVVSPGDGPGMGLHMSR